MKKYIVILLSLIYLDIVFVMLSYGGITFYSFINIMLFNLINAGIIFFLTTLFSDKLNSFFKYFSFSVMGVLYSTYYIFYKIFQTPFSIALIRQSDQVAAFAGDTIGTIFNNIHIIILFLMPVIWAIILRKYILLLKVKKKEKVITAFITILSIILYLINPLLQEKGAGFNL